jgi:hypothetical protein
MPESNNEPFNKIYKSQIAEEKWKDEFYKKTVHELKTEERFVTYFKQFDPDSVEKFIQSYATQKVQWHLSGQRLKQWEQLKRNDWMKDCFVALVEIQQKKLFDAQCLWRAEKLQMPCIEIGYDFMYWEEHIFACPDISPINEQDIELYTRYLRETSYDVRFDELKEYQDYDVFKDMQTETGNPFEYNPWYVYNNNKEGTGAYFNLPDIRGAKEEAYIKIYHNDLELKRSEGTLPPLPPSNFIPMFPVEYSKFKLDFAKRHETPAFYRMFVRDELEAQLYELNEHPELCISLLEEIPIDYLAIEPADDWRAAVTRTYERYRREKVIDLLPDAFTLYLKNLGHDWHYPGRSTLHKIVLDPKKGLSKHFVKVILQGRVLNGEPADLNF